MTLFGGGNYYTKENYTQRYVVNNTTMYTFRSEHSGTLVMRLPQSEQNVNVKVYEYTKFENVKFKMPLSTANTVNGSDDCNVFLMPLLYGNVTYKMTVTPLWDGSITVYGYDNTVIFSHESCEYGDTFEFDYACPANGGYPKIRSWEENTYCYFTINEIEE